MLKGRSESWQDQCIKQKERKNGGKSAETGRSCSHPRLVWRASHAHCRNARLNDITRFGTACLLQPITVFFLTHTKSITPSYTDHQFPTESLDKVSASCVWGVEQTKCSHIFILGYCDRRAISPTLYLLYLAVLTLHYQCTMDRKICQEWEPW